MTIADQIRGFFDMPESQSATRALEHLASEETGDKNHLLLRLLGYEETDIESAFKEARL